MKQEVAVPGLQHAGAVQEAAMAGRSGANITIRILFSLKTVQISVKRSRHICLETVSTELNHYLRMEQNVSNCLLNIFLYAEFSH